MLEAGTHELDDDPLVVAIDDEGRQGIAFAVNEAISICVLAESAAACEGTLECGTPPGAVDGCFGVAVEQSQRDFGTRAPQCDSERLSALVERANGACVSGRSVDDVASIDPRVSGSPASCALVGDFGGIHL
jgi:hypothetical protein